MELASERRVSWFDTETAPSQPSPSQVTSQDVPESDAVELPIVCIVGLGYIGLPTAAMLAGHGFRVHGVEVDPETRATINSGKAHVIEPDLDQLVKAGIDSGRLKAFAQPAQAEAFMLCVPTPVDERAAADLSLVDAATRAICPFLRQGNLVILESTSPPGTTERIARIVHEETGLTDDQVYFAHAPERVLPGSILHEVVHNDRVVGGVNEASTQAAVKLYKTFVRGQIFTCHSRVAETVKLVENASRDGQIAFANELSILCDKLEIDVRELIELANRHPRVNILAPGCGVGGHCIAVDPWFLVDKAENELGIELPMIRTAREVNDGKPKWVADRVIEHAAKFKSPTIACLGATYKPNIDDLRESPAAQIVRDLVGRVSGTVLLVEPHIDAFDSVELCEMHDAIERADIVVFLVAHSQFRNISQETLAEKLVVDTCGATHQTLAPK
tara:strand:- start:146084 stop:147421 length:1338 start_codon:yes stop_codon:yes gene_type:complete